MSEFPTFAKDNLNFLREIDAALFQIIRSKITTIVPQPDDYSCPVCYGKSPWIYIHPHPLTPLFSF